MTGTERRYPCGCTYELLGGDGAVIFPATYECPEHAVITEMAEVILAEERRARQEQAGP